ncbi:uncharacterized protein [Erythrolamprus reginae]|uniref:uncharacterized protein isoform X2 n=1 Tax=Erythrolamprus reginae TaxID=121349 RepID=UPI00396C3D6E
MSGPENKPSKFSQAIIAYLASSGICVCPSKTNLGQALSGCFPTSGLFGIPLPSLRPSQHVEGVPEFLVDACEHLRPHLHTEGLFRKCGSMTRIKALKARLEAGERCLHMALPCDVATLVKQFLRSLPEPLIPAELQGSLCQVQVQSREDRDSLTLLLTCLLPPRNTTVLRYFLSFLQEVVARCAQNKMDLDNLSVIFVPNLFSGELSSQMGISKAEEQLRSHVAVTRVLISHATEIGVIPELFREKIHAAVSDLESKQRFRQGREEAEDGGAAGRRRRRRSVSFMVTEALSKFRSCRTFCACPDVEMKEESQDGSVQKISFGSKRKASEEVATVTELSIKKRRSDLGLPSSDPFDGNGEDCFNQQADITSMQGVAEPPTGKVQRKQSLSRKHPRRKSITPACNSLSPSLTERKQIGHKSLSIFSRNSKSQLPHSFSAKGDDPGGWFPLKKRRQDTGNLPTILPQWAGLQSYKVQEDQRGSPSHTPGKEASARVSFNPRALEEDAKSRRPGEPRPYFEVLNSQQNAGAALGKTGGLLVKIEALAETSRQGVVALAMRRRVLRRSLSWPEELSLKDATDETDFSPDEATASPGRPEGLGRAEPAQLGTMEVICGMKQLSLHRVEAPPESSRAGCSANESCNLSPKLSLPRSEALEEAGQGLADPTPAGRFSPDSRQAPLRSNEELSLLDSPKPRTRRRFRRSISHESCLPLQDGVSKGGECKPPSKTPLQQFKACSRQIFITHKHIRSSLAGMWGRKEGYRPTGGTPDQQTNLLLGDHQIQPQSCHSPQNTAREL